MVILKWGQLCSAAGVSTERTITLIACCESFQKNKTQSRVVGDEDRNIKVKSLEPVTTAGEKRLAFVATKTRAKI